MNLIRISCFILLAFSLGCNTKGVIEAVVMQDPAVYQYEKVEFDIVLSQAFENPYDQKDIALNLIFTTPSDTTLLLPSYYESGNSERSLWKARFAPREVGEYSYKVEVLRNGQRVASTHGGPFQVKASQEDGFLHIHDFWTLQFDSGKPFRGIGENIGWEARSFEDPKWTYDYLLPTLASNGANFFRSWMAPNNFPLEWKTVRNTNRYSSTSEYFNPGGIERLDEVVEMADSLGLYMMLAFDSHNTLMEGNQWEDHNYNKLNGGPASTPTEFFTLEASREKYKNRLRYIVARWGYSTSIAAWEFFNEIDNAVFDQDDNILIPHAAVTDWHQEMSAYLKQIDPYDHIITTSLSHREIEGLYDLQDIDLNQMHVYRRTRQIPEEIIMYTKAHNKPFSWGEFGYEWDWNKDFSTMVDEKKHDYKIGLWYGMFSPTPILPMTWWWEFFDEHGMTPYFNAVAEINEHMLQAGGGSFEKLAVSAAEIEAHCVKSGENIYVYLVNHSGASQTAKVTIGATLEEAYILQGFSPETREYKTLQEPLSAAGEIETPALTMEPLQELILILSPKTS